MIPTLKTISESTTLTLSVVLLLLGGVWAFAWSARSTHDTVQKSSVAIEQVAKQLVETTAQLRAEIQLESSKRILRHEMEAWATEFRLMNPTILVPTVPRFQ